jgi:glutaredoxin 3
VARIEMYSSMMCPFCFRAKALLERKNVAVEVYDVDGNFALREQMMQRSGRHTVPQIFIDDQHIGGCDELYQLERESRLDPLLV